MPRYPVTVDTKTYRPTKHWLRFIQLGLKYTGSGIYKGSVKRLNVNRIRILCRNEHYIFKINNSLGTRSNDYRHMFFLTNSPSVLNGYFCSYCGRYVSKNKITVDHLYPIGRASKSLRLQRWLRFNGITDINDTRNLVPACERCNKSKGTHMGLWILKGILGRVQWLWYPRWILRFGILIYLVQILILHIPV